MMSDIRNNMFGTNVGGFAHRIHMYNVYYAEGQVPGMRETCAVVHRMYDIRNNMFGTM